VTGTGAARRYARALFEVTRESGDPAAVRGELDAIATLLADNRPLRSLLANPAIPSRVKKKLLTGLRKPVGWSDVVHRLLEMLVERGRAALLPALNRAYIELWNDSRRVVAAEAVSATPLDAAQQKALARAIREATGRDPELVNPVEPALLGGVVLRMSGRTYDGSVRSHLRALRRQLAEGRPA
jgi:F-type H+-transporting ATPase subunit delta